MPAPTPAATCALCHAPLPEPAAGPGRPAVYCSRSCQAKAYRARTAGHSAPAGHPDPLPSPACPAAADSGLPSATATDLARRIADAADRLETDIHAGTVGPSQLATLRALADQLIALAAPPTRQAVVSEHATASAAAPDTRACPPTPREEIPPGVTKSEQPANTRDPGRTHPAERNPPAASAPPARACPPPAPPRPTSRPPTRAPGPRRYTDAELNAYRLERVPDQIRGRRWKVLVAGDVLGEISPAYTVRGSKGWQAKTTSGYQLRQHDTRPAKTRQQAVIDLILHLGLR